MYRKTLYAYAVSFLVLVILILGSTFMLMYTNVYTQSTESSQQLLTQLVGSAEAVKSNVDNLMTLISGDRETLRFSKNRTENKMDNYRLFEKLRGMKMAYGHIQNIAVINGISNTSISVPRIPAETELQNQRMLTGIKESGRLIVSRTVNYYDKKGTDVVTFIQMLPYDDCTVLIDVNADWFQYELANSGEIGRSALVIDTVGEPVTSNARLKMEGQTTAEYLYALTKNRVEEEFFHTDAKSGKILFFKKTQALDWWFVDVQDLTLFYGSFQRMAMVFLGIAVCFILFCIVISAVFSRKIRKPLMQMVEKYRTALEINGDASLDELKYLDRTIAKVEHERHKNEIYLKNQLLRSGFLGEEVPFAISQETIVGLRKEYEAPFYAVMLFKVQSLQEIEEKKRNDEYKVFRYAVCNIAQEYFLPVFHCTAVDLGENLVGLLVRLDTQALPDEYVACYRQLKILLEAQIHVTLSAAIGPVVDDWGDIAVSYRRAKQYLEMGSFGKKDDVIAGVGSVSYQEKNEKLVESIVAYTKLHFADPDLSLKSIAQQFQLSVAYLGKIFKTVQGESFATYLTTFRLEQSKGLLLKTEKTVAEIAQGLGFANPTYYSTVFKNSFGMTPTAFRSKK